MGGGYDHLRYVPSTSTNTGTGIDRSYSPNKYTSPPSINLPISLPTSNPYIPLPSSTTNLNKYAYGSSNTDKSDTASVATYINKISDLDDGIGSQ